MRVTATSSKQAITNDSFPPGDALLLLAIHIDKQTEQHTLEIDGNCVIYINTQINLIYVITNIYLGMHVTLALYNIDIDDKLIIL